MQIGSFIFDDLMMATYQRGQSIETFFGRFAKLSGSDYILSIDDFAKAISSLDLDWNNSAAKISEFFNSLDTVAHQG